MLRKVNGRYWHDDTEISKSDYDALVSIVMEKNVWTNRVYMGEVSIDDVPVAWQEEIAERVKQRREEAEQSEEISMEEALEIILGGAV